MKSSSVMSAVEASSPPTFTTEDWWKITPCRLISQTLPFASSRPRMWLGAASSTRFRATDSRPGCRKRTTSSAPTSKLSQSITTLEPPWRIVVTAPCVSIRASPRLTLPPSGPARAERGCSPASAAASATAETPTRRAVRRRAEPRAATRDGAAAEGGGDMRAAPADGLRTGSGRKGTGGGHARRRGAAPPWASPAPPRPASWAWAARGGRSRRRPARPRPARRCRC